jgi:cation diffusion facilitator family transporter
MLDMVRFVKEILADEKQRVAGLSICSNLVLIILKLAAGIITNSVSIISEAIHSGLDLAAAFIAFFAVKVSSRPPDSRHRYGHGKFENVSGTIEAMLIFVAAIWIIIEAYQKIVSGSRVEMIGVGIGVMVISSIANWIISGILMRTAKKTDSVALEADGLHLRTDVYTSIGVVFGLAILSVTGIQLLDPLIAIVVALLIIKAAYELTVKAVIPLLDTSLPIEEEAAIENALQEIDTTDMIGFHELRTRKSGSERHIDMHLVVRPHLTIAEVHSLCDRIEQKIAEHLPNAHVLVHPEPCQKDECHKCHLDCY